MSSVTRRRVLAWAVAGTASVAAGVAGCSTREDVVVTGQVDAERASAYRAMTLRGLDQVADLWGEGRVVLPVQLHLPRSAGQWARATGQSPGRRDVAGSTVRRPGREPVVVIHPEAWEALTPEGRESVVTHEIAHLAMGPSGAAPWWLTEGLAEYTAHRVSDQRPARIAGSALPRLVADPPAGWPRGPSGSAPWQGYAAAWLACLFLAREVGERPLLRAYALTQDGTAWSQACRASLGRSASRLHGQWLTWLSALDTPDAAGPVGAAQAPL